MLANVVSSARTVRMCSLGPVLRLVVVRVELGGWMTVVSWNRLSKEVARSVDLQLCHIRSFNAFMCISTIACSSTSFSHVCHP